MAAGRAPNAGSHAKRLGYNAQQMLEHIRRDGRVPATLGYHVATWTFGHELAMVFLPGEVVLDYLRQRANQSIAYQRNLQSD